ncbi:glycogen debranching N-terminal domain-containing protein [Streptomyces sp. DSM 44915]|uniref:Glycogen debranching N-terminal domain-containing protein n=1 Tax=Streptomyces chisholmiae TaxID=3075540 RepID=A0ABU2K0P1_9ACTN|nr:glycogen debranching N-terminal domain-containing protein [Streptomyces sp. DSM 44915]MDT0270809.1 glycogen debranching N-terminal domain-containing protein [Streptomyces sp. DSM 44915]
MTPTHHCLLVRDGTFAAVGEGGDITGERGVSPDGLFARDARHLSRWQLTVDGGTPTVLVPTPTGPAADRAGSVLTQPGGRADAPAFTVFREQAVRQGEFLDHIRVNGNGPQPIEVLLALTVDVDFADQFELRDDHRWYQKPHAVRTREKLPDGIEFGYRRREWHARTVVTAEPAPDAVEETGSGARRLCWRLTLPAHGSTTLRLRVAAHPHGAPAPAAEEPAGAQPARRFAPEHAELARACAQGDADLAALRLPMTGPEGEALRVPAAGVPWFLTLLGRHALLTSLLTLDSHPELGHDTLLALAATQATEEVPERIAQPGKIVHEVRHGELAHFQQVPYGRYFGSVDATPLFLVLLGAHAERTRDDKLAHRLERAARAAVSWMFDHGGLADHGYLRYRADEGGLANQSWKDSPGAICFPDGTPARGAIVAAAPQGYAYAALTHTAELARAVWADPDYADQLTGAADALRERFLSDFWLPAEGFTALALDGDGRQVPTLGSDAGHLLWTGVLDQPRADAVAERLLAPEFFSGWGLRTLAAGQDAYHPLSYHRGGVWPHDSAVAALGLARAGHRPRAGALADGLLALAAAHDYRMPEVITGYARADHPEPVPYPHACSPQSWAAAAPFALLTALAD